MKLARVKIPKSRLNAISQKEQVFFVHLGSILNELNLLQKCIIYSTNGIESLSEIERKAQNFQALFFIRILAGKLNEGWEVLKKDFFKTRLSKDCKDALSPQARCSLAQLKRYFTKQNSVRLIRDKFAFHYDSEQVSQRIDKLPVDEVLEIFTSMHSGNCLCCFSDVVLGMAVLTSIDPCNPTRAIDRLIREVALDATGWFRQFGEDCLCVILEKLKPLKRVWIEIPEPPLIDTVKLPYFARKSK